MGGETEYEIISQFHQCNYPLYRMWVCVDRLVCSIGVTVLYIFVVVIGSGGGGSNGVTDGAETRVMRQWDKHL